MVRVRNSVPAIRDLYYCTVYLELEKLCQRSTGTVLYYRWLLLPLSSSTTTEVPLTLNHDPTNADNGSTD